jgi:leishmanolysin
MFIFLLLASAPLHQDNAIESRNHGGPTHNCMHNTLKRAAPVRNVPQRYSKLKPGWARRLKMVSRAAWEASLAPPQAGTKTLLNTEDDHEPIRIHVDYSKIYSDPGFSCHSTSDRFHDEQFRLTPCGYRDIITPEKRKIVEKQILPGAVEFFHRLLRVRRVQGNLQVRTSNCGFDGGVQVPYEARSAGVPEADFLILLTMRPIASQDTVAFSGHCEQDQSGRPTVAQFNWAPAQLRVAQDAFNLEYLIRIAMHELTHSLVFSPELLSYFNAGPATTWLETRYGVKTHVGSPRVVRAARLQFGCDSLGGAMLEDGGGAGTASTHWEMRWFRDEYMVGSSSPGKKFFSALSAALFADSGWWVVSLNLDTHAA